MDKVVIKAKINGRIAKNTDKDRIKKLLKSKVYSKIRKKTLGFDYVTEISLKIPKEVRDELKFASEKTGRTMQEIVNSLLEEAFKHPPTHCPECAGDNFVINNQSGTWYCMEENCGEEGIFLE